MSILDNEGHDPNGLGNTPSRSVIADQREYIVRLERLLNEASTSRDRLRAAATNLMAAIDNMHERGETFTARVSIACADMREALA
jgi:hypothetical protein